MVGAGQLAAGQGLQDHQAQGAALAIIEALLGDAVLFEEGAQDVRGDAVGLLGQGAQAPLDLVQLALRGVEQGQHLLQRHQLVDAEAHRGGGALALALAGLGHQHAGGGAHHAAAVGPLGHVQQRRIGKDGGVHVAIAGAQAHAVLDLLVQGLRVADAGDAHGHRHLAVEPGGDGAVEVRDVRVFDRERGRRTAVVGVQRRGG